VTATRAPVTTLRVGVLLAGFAAAVGLRVLVGGADVARSARAGVLFGVCLVLLALAARTRVQISWPNVAVGLGGAALLCLPVVLHRSERPLAAATGFASWAVIVSFVAVAEEVFLRGALYDAVTDAAGDLAAIAVAAVSFALLHVPLYGWHVVPLDLVVGVLLGELRRRTGTAATPAVTHVAADLAGWFLR
jgi:membrane protease YdiL (CAAX protease family)